MPQASCVRQPLQHPACRGPEQLPAAAGTTMRTDPWHSSQLSRFLSTWQGQQAPACRAPQLPVSGGAISHVAVRTTEQASYASQHVHQQASMPAQQPAASPAYAAAPTALPSPQQAAQSQPEPANFLQLLLNGSPMAMPVQPASARGSLASLTASQAPVPLTRLLSSAPIQAHAAAVPAGHPAASAASHAAQAARILALQAQALPTGQGNIPASVQAARAQAAREPLDGSVPPMLMLRRSIPNLGIPAAASSHANLPQALPAAQRQSGDAQAAPMQPRVAHDRAHVQSSAVVSQSGHSGAAAGHRCMAGSSAKYSPAQQTASKPVLRQTAKQRASQDWLEVKSLLQQLAQT